MPKTVDMKKYMFALLLVFMVVNTAIADIPQSEKNALVDLYNATNGEAWQNKWDINSAVGQWHGVKLVNDHVVEINLFHNNLQGAIPASIGDLTNLNVLNLAFNGITGELPATIVKLEKLKVLKLEMNRIKGQLPIDMGNMAQLIELSAFNNFLTGSIPVSLGNIKSLKILNLSSNNLKGEIPEALGNLKSLVVLGLFENGLEGSIPNALGNLSLAKGTGAGEQPTGRRNPKGIWAIGQFGGLTNTEQQIQFFQKLGIYEHPGPLGVRF